MEIQQHDGVVVDAAAITAGLCQASTRGRGGAWGEGGARDLGAAALPPPTIYRTPRGVPSLGDPISKGGWPRGACPPSQVGRPPKAQGEAHGGRTSPPGAGSPPTSAHGAIRDRWPHLVDPRDPSVVPVQYR